MTPAASVGKGALGHAVWREMLRCAQMQICSGYTPAARRPLQPPASAGSPEHNPNRRLHYVLKKTAS
jgi:hypothetical protein